MGLCSLETRDSFINLDITKIEDFIIITIIICVKVINIKFIMEYFIRIIIYW